MISVSNEYKSAITKPRTIDGKVVIGNTTLTSKEVNQIRRTFNTTLFKSVLKQVELDSNVPIQKGQTINPQVGLLLNNGFEYVSLGSYKAINEPILNKDTKSYQISTYDKIVESMVAYELTQSDITFPCSVRELFVAIFTKLGWDLNGIPSTFVNSTSQIEEDVYSNMNMTYRDVLDELCTISCMFLVDKGSPKLIQMTNTNETINEQFMKSTNVQIKEKVFFNSLVFSRTSDSDNIYRKDDESIEEKGLHEFKVSDLQILSLNWRNNFIDTMWSYIKTFEYYSYEIDTYGITYLEPIDGFTLSTFNETYNTLLLNSDLIIGNGMSEKIYADLPMETETEYKYADTTDKKINQTYLIVDKQNQQIQSVVTNVENQNQRISSITQTVDEINQKIQDIADITTSGESSYGRVELLNVNESEPISIRIRPTTMDITAYYPTNTSYPSDTLYPKDRILRFTNTTTSEVFNYQLPNDLLFYDENNYDEFSLAYGDGTNKSCVITKKVEHTTTNGVNQLMSQEQIITYPYPTINLTDGDYVVELLGYSNAYLYVQLMASNIYTTQFATRVELSSSINQTKDEINLEVSKKVDSDKVIASINLTSESATIDANKINIKGTLQAINNDTTTTINGNKITTGSITASQVSSEIITASNLSAQTISANQITTGTLSANRISGGTINGSNVNITNLSASNITSGRLNITSGSYYLRMGFNEGNHPSVSGLNVGTASVPGDGIKCYAGINARSYSITNSDTGKSASFQVPRQGGGWYYITFTGGILTAYERKN